MKFFHALALLALLSLLLNPSLAYLEKNMMKVYAIDEQNTPLMANLVLELEPGTGKVWSAITPLIGTSTQNTERISVQIGKGYAVGSEGLDYKFTIESSATLVDGPSAGAAMALLTVSALQNKKVPSNVSVTGSISEDGTVGPVGGVFEKASYADKTGIELFMIPRGERSQLVRTDEGIKKIDLVVYAEKEWGLKVVEVDDIDEVLEYAFSDIESIKAEEALDVNDFIYVPEKAVEKVELAVMKELTESNIVRVNGLISDARKAVEVSMIEEGQLLSIMLSTLNSSEELTKEAELLIERNYIYTAANEVFLAEVNANLVLDIAKNPSLLQADSTAFSLMVSELKKEIRQKQKELPTAVPVEGLEWYVGAMERLYWAKNNLDALEAPAIIIVSSDSAIEDVIDDLRDYEFAKAWYNASIQMLSFADLQGDLFVVGEDFKPQVQEMIVETEDLLSVLGSDVEREGVDRRIAGAKQALIDSRYFVAWYEASSAMGLAKSEKYLQGADSSKALGELSSRIGVLQGALGNSGKHLWAKLFLDHAEYFLKKAQYFSDKNQMSRMKNETDNAASLIFLAESLYDSSLIMTAYVASNQQNVLGKQVELPLWQIQLVLFLVVIVVLGVIIVRLLVSSKAHTLERRIEKKREAISGLEVAYSKGKIKEGAYKLIVEKHRRELEVLLKAHDERSKANLERDKLKAEVSALEHALRRFRAHYNEGIISDKDYKKAVKEYSDRLIALQKKVGRP